MSVTQLTEFRMKRSQELAGKTMEHSQFTMEALRSAIDSERYLTWNLALCLIHQVMLDHGIRIQDIKEHTRLD